VKETPQSKPEPLARAPEEDVSIPAWARRLAVLLDSAVTIPGTNVKIGLDPILGLLLPELGDTLTAAVSLTLLGVAFRERVPKLVLARMLVNIAIDALLGAIPLIGDLFDFAFRANDKNLALIERHRGDPTRPATLGDRLVVLGAGVIALSLVAVPFVVGALFVRWLLLVLSSS
jgi:hypothetical protein